MHPVCSQTFMPLMQNQPLEFVNNGSVQLRENRVLKFMMVFLFHFVGGTSWGVIGDRPPVPHEAPSYLSNVNFDSRSSDRS